MSIEREMKRRRMHEDMKLNGMRTRCRKCGARMVAFGAGWCCEKCGWMSKAQIEIATELYGGKGRKK